MEWWSGEVPVVERRPASAALLTAYVRRGGRTLRRRCRVTAAFGRQVGGRLGIAQRLDELAPEGMLGDAQPTRCGAHA